MIKKEKKSKTEDNSDYIKEINGYKELKESRTNKVGKTTTETGTVTGGGISLDVGIKGVANLTVKSISLTVKATELTAESVNLTSKAAQLGTKAANLTSKAKDFNIFAKGYYWITGGTSAASKAATST